MKKIILSALFAAGVASASDYGKAGCGLGSVMFGADAGTFGQVLAVTTNGSTFTKYFAISSGTSNCTESGVAMESKEQEFFLSNNYQSITQEMAQGSGENLEAFANMFGCYGTEAEAFGAVMQENFVTIVPSADVTVETTLENVKSIANQELSCSVS